MTILTRLLDSPVSQALGWAMVHSLWQGVLIAAALWAVLIRCQSAKTRYVSGCLALGALFAALSVTFVHELPAIYPAGEHLGRVALPAWAAASAHAAGDNSGFAQVIPLLTPIWVIGVCLFYLRCTIAWFTTSGLRERGVIHAPRHWQARVDELARHLQISRPVVLLESLIAEAPMVIGHLRPVILAPIGFFAGLPPSHVEAILLHELAHVRRCDYLANVIQRLLEGALFYHPAAWWISRTIRAEREHCCDDIAVSRDGNAHAYAEALASLELNRQSLRTAVAANGGDLMKRIRRLLYRKGPGNMWAPILTLVILTACTAGMVSAWAPQETSKPTQNVWDKWLNEDVVYIISDQERTAFEHLTTDEERQHFVEQFWDRRNPNPGAAENAFKEEHYRRIGFANKHFGQASGTPGWKTDRGHMYIIYGPPDEIESHPKPGGSQHPYEDWKYRGAPGTEDDSYFHFVDSSGTGDYRLAPTVLPKQP